LKAIRSFLVLGLTVTGILAFNSSASATCITDACLTVDCATDISTSKCPVAGAGLTGCLETYAKDHSSYKVSASCHTGLWDYWVSIESSATVLSTYPALFPSSSGSSGLTPPPQAAALGYTKLALNQGGSAGWDIDDNTGDAGHVWYQGGFSGKKYAPGNFSVSDGVLTVTNNITGYNYNWTLSTAETAKNAQKYVGTVFRRGYYAEATISATTPNTEGLQKGGWPAFWADSLPHFIGEAQWPGQPAGFEQWNECDFFELWQTHYTFSMLSWYGHSGTSTTACASPYCRVGNNNGQNNIPDYSVGKVPAGTKWSDFNTYGSLLVPATSTSDGYSEGYFNNSLATGKNTWAPYKSSATPSGLKTNVGNQAFSVGDTQSDVIVLGTGPDAPMKVNMVRIWVKP